MKVLWVGDAAVASGFAKCTHAACDELYNQGDEVSVIGINHRGDPHPYPYDIYPSVRGNTSDDTLGVTRTGLLTKTLQPDVVVLLNDPWNIPKYVRAIRTVNKTVPIVGWLAVDGRNCRGDMLNDLALAVFWTKFAEEEAVLGGYTGKTAIVPLGVDLNTFYPHDREEARRREHFAEHVMNHFVVGVVGRNQPRKRLDLTVSYYAEWVHAFQIENAILLCHVAPTGDAGWDLQNLGLYYHLKNKMIINSPMDMGKGIDEDNLSWRYAAMDACVTTTQGEGWGLCTMEAMACGIPNIVPDWAALGEWCEDAALKVPCTQIAHTPGNINAQGGIADREQFIHALDKLYMDQTLRQTYRDRGLALVQRPVYRWATAGKSFRECLLKVVSSPNVMSANAG